MKTIKYLFAGAMMLSINAHVMAQDTKSQIEAITKTIVENKGDVKASTPAVKEFIKVNKKNAEALAGLGRAFLQAKNQPEAQKYADMAIKANKNLAAGYILKGDIAVINDEPGEAAMWFQSATMFDPSNNDGYVKYARIYQKIDPQGAVEMLEKLRKVNPSYPVDAAAGYMYSQNDKLVTAMSYYDKVQDVKALEDYILYDYAGTAYSMKDYEKALRLAKAGIEKYPDYFSFIRLAAFSANHTKDYQAALTYIQQYLAKEKAEYINDAVYMNYGEALKGLEKYEEAIAQYEKAYALNNENIEVFKASSDIYLASKDFDKAVEYQNKYIDALKDQANYKHYEAIADIYIDKSDVAKTNAEKVAALKKASEVFGTIAEKFDYAKEYAVYKRANIHHQINTDVKAGEAKPYYEEYIRLVEPKAEKTASEISKLATCYQYLAIHYIHNDNKTKAKECAAKAVEYNANDETCKQILAL